MVASDLNKRKERKDPGKSKNKGKWVTSKHHKGMEDSYEFFETVFGNKASKKTRPSSSFEEVQLTQPGEDDAWNFSPNESESSNDAS